MPQRPGIVYATASSGGAAWRRARLLVFSAGRDLGLARETRSRALARVSSSRRQIEGRVGLRGEVLLHCDRLGVAPNLASGLAGCDDCRTVARNVSAAGCRPGVDLA